MREFGIVTLLLVIGLGLISHKQEDKKCKSATFNTHYDHTVGCLIEVSKGRWVSAEF